MARTHFRMCRLIQWMQWHTTLLKVKAILALTGEADLHASRRSDEWQDVPVSDLKRVQKEQRAGAAPRSGQLGEEPGAVLVQCCPAHAQNANSEYKGRDGATAKPPKIERTHLRALGFKETIGEALGTPERICTAILPQMERTHWRKLKISR
jgi:hypothetical protein